MTKQSLLALADRVEKAEGPSRELDADIAIETGWRHRSGADWHRVLEWERPVFTASIDAAMQLVDPAWVVKVARYPNDLSLARIAVLYPTQKGTAESNVGANAATPALALTSASLRAVAETM